MSDIILFTYKSTLIVLFQIWFIPDTISPSRTIPLQTRNHENSIVIRTVRTLKQQQLNSLSPQTREQSICVATNPYLFTHCRRSSLIYCICLSASPLRRSRRYAPAHSTGVESIPSTNTVVLIRPAATDGLTIMPPAISSPPLVTTLHTFCFRLRS
jgi:hypothetical protein